MSTIANKNTSAFLSYFSLFSSIGTLLCCALPSVLVLVGLGTTVAATLSALPLLVTLSHHKSLTFGISGFLIAAGYLNTYYIAPRFRARACSPNSPDACEAASRFSKIVLGVSAVLYAAGFFVAFLLGPILSSLEHP